MRFLYRSEQSRFVSDQSKAVSSAKAKAAARNTGCKRRRGISLCSDSDGSDGDSDSDSGGSVFDSSDDDSSDVSLYPSKSNSRSALKSACMSESDSVGNDLQDTADEESEEETLPNPMSVPVSATATSTGNKSVSIPFDYREDDDDVDNEEDGEVKVRDRRRRGNSSSTGAGTDADTGGFSVLGELQRLRKICNCAHPDEAVSANFSNEASLIESLLARSCKLEVVDMLLQATREGLQQQQHQQQQQSTGREALTAEMVGGDVGCCPKVVIVSNFTYMLDLVAQLAAARGYGQCLRIDGDTAVDKRQDQVDCFNRASNHTATIFLLSAKAGGVGLNL